eukprot:scaffold18772_cov112-Isochrysis_galbana.AAC.16
MSSSFVVSFACAAEFRERAAIITHGALASLAGGNAAPVLRAGERSGTLSRGEGRWSQRNTGACACASSP